MLKKLARRIRLKRGQSIVVNLYDDGSSEVEAHGFSGEECFDAAAFLEETLGSVQDVERKKNRFRSGTGQVKERLRG